jgi:hypothetical protein
MKFPGSIEKITVKKKVEKDLVMHYVHLDVQIRLDSVNLKELHQYFDRVSVFLVEKMQMEMMSEMEKESVATI